MSVFVQLDYFPFKLTLSLSLLHANNIIYDISRIRQRSMQKGTID